METKELTTLEEEAKQLLINNDEDYRKAGSKLKELKEIKKKFDDHYLPLKKKAHETYKLSMAHIKEYEVPIKKAETIIKTGMAAYVTKKDAERKAQEEKLRIEAEKRRAKAEAEAKKKIEKELKKTGMDKQQIEHETEKVIIKAEEIKLEDTTKMKGVQHRDIWKFDITDFSKVPDEYKIINTSAINNIIKKDKDKSNIPGIRVYSEKITVV